jgi:hypothetical protein
MKPETAVKAILYVAVAAWAVVLFASGQQMSSDALRPLSTVTTVVVFAVMAFDLWLWKWRVFHGWLVKRPVIDGTWKAELRTNWVPAAGGEVPPIEAYVVVRQTLSNLSIRLMTAESSSTLVGNEIVCAADGLYCVSGVYRNEPRLQFRERSPIHYGAVWLEVITTPSEAMQGQYWTDRNTAGQMSLSQHQSVKFQDFKAAKAHFDALPKTKALSGGA